MDAQIRLIRYPDWQQCLEGAIKYEVKKSVEWGKHDCCLVAFGLVRAITGVHLFPYRGQYSSYKELRAIGYNDFGFEKAMTMEDLSRRLLGDSIETDAARVGDMMCFEKGKRNSLGTLTAAGAMFRSFGGMIFAPPSRCKCAWKIG